jgi:hypothetical protein
MTRDYSAASGRFSSSGLTGAGGMRISAPPYQDCMRPVTSSSASTRSVTPWAKPASRPQRSATTSAAAFVCCADRQGLSGRLIVTIPERPELCDIIRGRTGFSNPIGRSRHFAAPASADRPPGIAGSSCSAISSGLPQDHTSASPVQPALAKAVRQQWAPDFGPPGFVGRLKRIEVLLACCVGADSRSSRPPTSSFAP